MAGVLPMIIYPSSLVESNPANQTRLAFKNPPKGLDEYSPEYVRHDRISTAGVTQTLVERIDHFLTFQMPWIDDDDDLDGNGLNDLGRWEAFLEFAMTGGAFDFYIDLEDENNFKTYQLWGPTKPVPKHTSPYRHALAELTFREVVTG
jgi:hypothetical protein